MQIRLSHVLFTSFFSGTFALAACGGSSGSSGSTSSGSTSSGATSSGATSSGATSSSTTGSSSTTSSGTTSSSSSGAGGGGGGETVACYLANNFDCMSYTGPAASVDGQKTVCMNLKGVVSSSCPTANLLGCCRPPTSGDVSGEVCYYSGGPYTLDIAMTGCSGQKGTWSASP